MGLQSRGYQAIKDDDLDTSRRVLLASAVNPSRLTSNPWFTSSYNSVDTESPEIKNASENDTNENTTTLGKWTKPKIAAAGISLSFALFILFVLGSMEVENLEANAWSSIASPFSIVSPVSLGFIAVDRPAISSPGPIFKNLVSRQIPLPTNSWCENFFLGKSNTGPENKVFQVPYILDTAGPIQGIRTHSTHVQANDRAVMMTYELENGLTLGAVETFNPQHEIVGDTTNAIGRLAIVLEWKSEAFKRTGSGAHMSSPVVRGAPYTSMQYNMATPRLRAQRFVSKDPIVDSGPSLVCGDGFGNFGASMRVTKEIRLQFDTSDMTWLVFVSEPMDFACSSTKPVASGVADLPPGVVPPADPTHEAQFELKAMAPVRQGMVRVAMGNNCTTGQNPIYCQGHQPRDQGAYMTLLRDHADIYPTGKQCVLLISCMFLWSDGWVEGRGEEDTFEFLH